MESSNAAMRENEAQDDVTIWRYMDLPRFISMLSTRQLRFTKAATYRDDPWEGFCEVKHLELPAELTTESPGHALYALASNYSREEYQSAPQRLFVNSWCRWRESMSMWDLYGSRGSGVAVTSTAARYRTAVKFVIRKEQCALGRVHYHENLESADAIHRDLTKHALQSGRLWRDILELAFHKRGVFEAENEWRAALYQPPEQLSSGVDIDCDLDELIDEVYVGPRAEPFVHAVVRDITEKYGLRKPVSHSTLLEGPLRQSKV